MDKDIRTQVDESYASLLSELKREFPRRLKECIGERSVHSFATACGLSDSLIRKYLAGSLPGLDKVVIIAREAGVSVEWLATGRNLDDSATRPPLNGVLSTEYIEEVVAKTRREFIARGINLKPEDEAKVIRLICEFNAIGASGPEPFGADNENVG